MRFTGMRLFLGICSEKNWTDRFDLIDYLDDRQQFWAVVVLHNKSRP